MPELGGGLWLLIDVVLVVLLAAAMIYGIMKWRQRRRDPTMQNVREDATRRVYHDEEMKRRAYGQE
jgi:hypothetical protein